MNQLCIRAATPDDLNAVYEFMCILEKETLDLTRFNALFLRNLGQPSVRYLVAEQAGEVVGFASCHVQELLHHNGKVGEIQEIFVRADRRGQHVGRQLVAALRQRAVREGWVNLEVTTRQQRTDAIRFYERIGFNRTHVKLVQPIQR